MTKSQQITESGPILGHLPEPPDVATRLVVTKKLSGHTTSEAFLPEGLHPGLDDLRAEQLRLRRQVVALLEDRLVLLAEHATEDKAHAEALKRAARDGATPPEGGRTAPEQRDRDLAGLEGRIWASVHVLGEHADSIIEFARRHENELLADQRSRLGPLQEKRAEAQRLLAEAEAGAWRCHQLGRWVQNLADDEAFGRQPAPALVAPPAQFNRELLKDSLERPWHRVRDWAKTKAEVAA